MKKWLLGFILVCFSTLLYAEPVKEFVVLGDSLSDNGNLYNLIKVVPKSPPYFEGRFTNGPTWAETVGKNLYSKYYIDYQIYAYGGATSIFHNPVHDSFIAPTTLTGEIYSYLAHSYFKNKSDVLYTIWIGANDYLYDRKEDLDGLTTDVVNNIVWATNQLIAKGAKHFLIMNLPDLSHTPFATNHQLTERLAKLTLLHNQKLAMEIDKLKTDHPDVSITFVNIFDIFSDLLQHPEKFNEAYHTNINNLTESCWRGGFMLKNDKDRLLAELKTSLNKDKTININHLADYILNMPALATAYRTDIAYEEGLKPCANSENYVFWDELHPTSAVHDMLSVIILKQLQEEHVV